jgi:hypothetical protein
MWALPDRTQCFPSAHHRFHQGVITIVGGLLVLSLILLLTGATPAHAQPGQDTRCAGFSGQARGLCTAAVSAGCFDGVQSQGCDALLTTWTTHCATCPAGTPPWLATCPCNFSLAQLSAGFIDGSAPTQVLQDAGIFLTFIEANPPTPIDFARAVVQENRFREIECFQFIRLCRKFCSGGREGVVAPVGGEIRRPGSRTVRPQ